MHRWLGPSRGWCWQHVFSMTCDLTLGEGGSRKFFVLRHHTHLFFCFSTSLPALGVHGVLLSLQAYLQLFALQKMSLQPSDLSWAPVRSQGHVAKACGALEKPLRSPALLLTFTPSHCARHCTEPRPRMAARRLPPRQLSSQMTCEL